MRVHITAVMMIMEYIFTWWIGRISFWCLEREQAPLSYPWNQNIIVKGVGDIYFRRAQYTCSRTTKKDDFSMPVENCHAGNRTHTWKRWSQVKICCSSSVLCDLTWLEFEFWNLIKICVRTCYFGKQNSTLGSVVPLAMFKHYFGILYY